MTAAAFTLWTVYDHPKDWPHGYIARKFVDGRPSNETIFSCDLARIRDHLEFMGFYRISRQAADDPVIIEVWL